MIRSIKEQECWNTTN